MTYIYWFLAFCLLVLLFSKYILKKTKYGFFITMWEFWAGKTQNMTAYLKGYKNEKEINITNYYTGYTHFQLSSHQDLVNIMTDIYDYHQYINLYDDRIKLHTHKPYISLVDYEVDASAFRKKYPEMRKNMKFNIVLDEASIYFNPRNFKSNFSWKNEMLLDFIYQPRKLNVLMFCVVQSPMELDVKFRRLATYYRKYYMGLRFYRWYKDFYFLDPEQIDLEKAEQVWGGVIMGMNLNFYPYFPRFDYNTKELIRPGIDIYQKWAIFQYIQNLWHAPKKENFPTFKKLFDFKNGWKVFQESSENISKD